MTIEELAKLVEPYKEPRPAKVLAHTKTIERMAELLPRGASIFGIRILQSDFLPRGKGLVFDQYDKLMGVVDLPDKEPADE
jgi:hypothetical protein